MRWLAAVALLSGCMTQAWTTPQPYFRTTQPEGAWQRTVAAVKANCGGVTSVNEEAQIVIGAWELWTTGDGLVITQCIASLMRGDDYIRDVRVTFSSRRCPLSDLDTPIDELVKTCTISETVPEQVKNGLVVTGEKLERDINAVR